MPEPPKSLEDFRRGWLEESEELVRAAITDDFLYVDPFGQFEGAHAMERYVATSFRRFRDFSLTFVRLAVSDDVIGVEWQMGMTGDVEGIDGKRVDLQGAGMITVRDGLLASWHDYWDTPRMAQQLGLASVEMLQG